MGFSTISGFLFILNKDNLFKKSLNFFDTDFATTFCRIVFTFWMQFSTSIVNILLWFELIQYSSLGFNFDILYNSLSASSEIRTRGHFDCSFNTSIVELWLVCNYCRLIDVEIGMSLVREFLIFVDPRGCRSSGNGENTRLSKWTIFRISSFEGTTFIVSDSDEIPVSDKVFWTGCVITELVFIMPLWLIVFFVDFVYSMMSEYSVWHFKWYVFFKQSIADFLYWWFIFNILIEIRSTKISSRLFFSSAIWIIRRYHCSSLNIGIILGRLYSQRYMTILNDYISTTVV